MAKAKSAKPAVAKKIVDVARPNKSAPSETSKPVIISHRPLMRDPMMAAPAGDPSTRVALPEPVTTAVPTSVKRERLIIPPSAAATASLVIAGANGPLLPTAAFTINKSAPKPQPTAETVKSTPAVAPAETVATPTLDVDTIDAEKSEPLTPVAAEAQAEAKLEKRQQALAKLVADETYFLPVDSVGQKRAQRMTIVGVVLILVLGAAWFNIALDANLITIDGVEAPTNFFSN